VQNPKSQVITQVSAQYQGPIPPPEHFAGYERVLPGAAERILRLAEQQASHRQSLETAVIHADIAASRRGTVVAAVLGGMALVGGFVLILIGRQIEGSIFAGGPMAALVTAFLIGSSKRQRERASKNAGAGSPRVTPTGG
jgi:uncharacterized membrane protein